MYIQQQITLTMQKKKKKKYSNYSNKQATTNYNVYKKCNLVIQIVFQIIIPTKDQKPLLLL